ncbi:receptor activity-modifying protein 1-like isoform X2 [Betta splendens]|uniref:Receptor activity-modifying protein 1-like isoform X2 n=1 Tax=Betta splendens TaxID=158456 RepID=A0A6P7LDU9_BETSP|nr:receptor activity-modifying protein 1-like isoform X2 [Betta splendens]
MVFTAYLLAGLLTYGGASRRTVPPCDQHAFYSNIDICLSDFNRSLESSGHEQSCPWPAVKSSYNRLKACVDHWAISFWCKGHKYLVDDVFLGVHQKYFSVCDYNRDPPLTTLLTLILPGVIATFLIPFLCLCIVNVET